MPLSGVSRPWAEAAVKLIMVYRRQPVGASRLEKRLFCYLR